MDIETLNLAELKVLALGFDRAEMRDVHVVKDGEDYLSKRHMGVWNVDKNELACLAPKSYTVIQHRQATECLIEALSSLNIKARAFVKRSRHGTHSWPEYKQIEGTAGRLVRAHSRQKAHVSAIHCSNSMPARIFSRCSGPACGYTRFIAATPARASCPMSRTIWSFSSLIDDHLRTWGRGSLYYDSAILAQDFGMRDPMILLKEDRLENSEMTSEQIASLQPALARLLRSFRPCFGRDKTFAYLEQYVQGLLSDVKRKSIEPIALAAGVAVRTLQEFLAFFRWDEDRAGHQLIRLVAQEHSRRDAIGVLDASGHAKQGDKTPGVQRQWCGESGKIDNCVVGQHLLYTDNDPKHPFSCVLASDLFLPEDWANDPDRCQEAGIPEAIRHRPKWKLGIEQVRQANREGIRFAFLAADEDYGKVPAFWFDLDEMGQWAVAEVPKNFLCWPTPPAYCSTRSEYAAKRVDNIVRHSPLFTGQSWKPMRIKETTRGPCLWQVKAGQVHLVDTRPHQTAGISQPTDRTYWLIVARNKATGEIKYFVSNAPSRVPLRRLLEVAFGRWHIEKWFERAKQETGFGSFEVRTYRSLIRHWLASRIAMYFLAHETRRLRGEKSADHAGAGGGCGEHVGLEYLETLAPLVGLVEATM